MPTITRSVLMGSVIGVLAYSTASTVVGFVRTRTDHLVEPLFIYQLTPFLPPLSTAGCQAVWCPCVVYSKNRQRLHHLQEHGSALPGGGETYNGPCYIYGGLLLLSARYVWTKHVCLAILPDNCDLRMCPRWPATLRHAVVWKFVSATAFV